jgi:ubiquinone/menaquinone biosynthesis C-methylase UbiE
MDTYFQTISLESPAIVYNELLIPRLLEPWNRSLLELTSLQPGEWVLAAPPWSESLISMASEKVGPTGRVVAAGPAVALVKSRFNPGPGSAPIDEVETTPLSLNVPPHWFEAAFCQQGLQHYPQPEIILREIHTALKPHGRLGLSIWQQSERNPLFDALHEVLVEIQIKKDPTRTFQQGLLWYDSRQLVTLLSNCGFQNIHITLETIPIIFEGGIPQILASINTNSLWNTTSTMSPREQGIFEQKLVDRLKPFVQDDKIAYWASAYMALATA